MIFFYFPLLFWFHFLFRSVKLEQRDVIFVRHFSNVYVQKKIQFNNNNASLHQRRYYN
jgi:hypothetical protein